MSGIGGLQGGSITRAASVLGLTTSPLSATAASDFSFQTLSDICFSTTSSSHFTFFFFNSIFVCQRYVNLSESADRERKKGMEGFQLPDRE